MLNRAVCDVSGFKPTLKRSNLRTLCNVVVYHLAVVTETRNQAKRAKRPKRSTTTQSDKQRVIKTNKQKIDNDPIKQAKTSSALLGTSGKIDLTAFFMAGAKPDLCGLFIQKRLQNKWITGEICMGLFFFHDCHGRCMHFSICKTKNRVRKNRKNSLSTYHQPAPR